jgi:hypothetical protein
LSQQQQQDGRTPGRSRKPVNEDVNNSSCGSLGNFSGRRGKSKIRDATNNRNASNSRDVYNFKDVRKAGI